MLIDEGDRPIRKAMSSPTTVQSAETEAQADGIREISVSGFKSISDEQTIEIRPLTILAGANSSGKSSIMQPLLLMKQTLEQTYDPGPLYILGPHTEFDRFDQMFSRTASGIVSPSFRVRFTTNRHAGIATTFEIEPEKRELLVRRQEILFDSGKKRVLYPGMSHEMVLRELAPEAQAFAQANGVTLSIERVRFLLEVRTAFPGRVTPIRDIPGPAYEEVFGLHISKLIHAPGVRRKPQRKYGKAALGPILSGTFEDYVATLLLDWESGEDASDGKLKAVSADMEELGLTSRVRARRRSDVLIEIEVARPGTLGISGEPQMMSIADVGIGVSQALPVLVALQHAQPGQLIYLEQPELHLHPRAQTKLAGVLARAAMRGVRVVVETHSSLLLLAIQTLAAKGELLTPDKVKLHWFELQDGATKVTSADLDKTGSFKDWPQDFTDVELEADGRYIDAAEAVLFGTHAS